MSEPTTPTIATVLVIDDDSDMCDAIAMALESSGYKVLRAENGAEALRVLGKVERLPDAIVLDLMMPIMDGEKFREAQLREPRLAHIPVALLSGHAQVSKRAAEMNVDAYIQKPLDLSDLLSGVKRLVGRSRGDVAAHQPT